MDDFIVEFDESDNNLIAIYSDIVDAPGNTGGLPPPPPTGQVSVANTVDKQV